MNHLPNYFINARTIAAENNVENRNNYEIIRIWR